MTLRDEIAQEIARKLIEDRLLIEPHRAQTGQPAPKAKEVDASAYPPRTVRSWCIPIPRRMVDHHPRATWTSEIADLEKTIDSLWLERDGQPWTNGSLAVYVWHGYHAETNTIYYAIHPAPLPELRPAPYTPTTASAPTRTPADHREATTASAPTRTP